MKRLLAWLTSADEDKTDSQEELTLAAAVLHYEILFADGKASLAEVEKLEQYLLDTFDLDPDAISLLVNKAKQTHGTSVDLVQFTRQINKACQGEQKEQLLQSLWQLAFADGELDPNEEHLIRRIADLLYLSHSQFIQSKHFAQLAI